MEPHIGQEKDMKANEFICGPAVKMDHKGMLVVACPAKGNMYHLVTSALMVRETLMEVNLLLVLGHLEAGIKGRLMSRDSTSCLLFSWNSRLMTACTVCPQEAIHRAR